MSKNSCVGLFADRENLCVVEISKSKEGFKLENIATSPLGFKIIEGRIVDPQSAALELQKFFDTAGFSHRNIYVGVPEQGMVVRLINVPQMPRREMREVMSGEAEQYALFSGKEIALDFFVADEIKERTSKTNSVLLAATTKDVVESWSSTCDAAGLELGGIAPATIAFLNGVLDIKKKSGFYCYMVVTSGGTFLYFIRDGKLKFLRQVDFARDLMDSVVSAAGQYKKDTPDEVFAPLNNFVDEVMSTLDFYAQQNPRDSKVEKVILCANPEKYKALELFLEKRLDMACDLENPMAWLDISGSAISPAYLENFEHQIPYAAGLAKSALNEKEVFSVNLLPDEGKVTTHFKRLTAIQFAAVPAALVFILLIYSFMIGSSIKKEHVRLASVEQEIKNYAEQAKMVENLKNQKQTLLSELGALDKTGGGVISAAAGGGFSFASLFQELRRITPKEVWITNIESDTGEQVVIDGYSKTQVGVSMFLAGIKATPVFLQPALLQYSESALIGSKNVVKFKVICRLLKG